MVFHSRRPRHDDLSRLLDPQYSPPSRNALLPASSHYHDQHGDIHDPDYRPFTPISRPTSRSPRRSTPAPRPYWETFVTEDETHSNSYDDEEDDEEISNNNNSSSARDDYSASTRSFSTGYNSRYSSRRPSGQYRRREQRHSYTYAPSYTPNYIYYTPASFSEHASSPTSFGSRTTTLEEEVFDEKEKEKQQGGWTSKLRRRRDRGKESSSDDVQGSEEAAKEPKREPSTTTTAPEKDEHVPTCNEVFQEQWQILKLRVNLSMFRTQRRLKQCVQSISPAPRCSYR